PGTELPRKGLVSRLIRRRRGGPGRGNGALISCEQAVSSARVEWSSWAANSQVPAGSPLLSSTYKAHEGPGIYLAARDTFQVYLNGVLIGLSDQVRTPLFLPVSLLPGENVI